MAASKGVIKGATKTRKIAKNRAFKQATVEAAPDIDQIKAIPTTSIILKTPIENKDDS